MVTTAALRDYSALGHLDARTLEVVAQAADERSFKAGTRFFAEGDPAIGCWLIVTGHVALQVSVPGRGDVVVQTLGPGDLLGWSWLVPPYRWHFAATAVETTMAYELDTDRLRAHADSDPELGYTLALGLLEQLLARLQNTRARLLDLYASSHD